MAALYDPSSLGIKAPSGGFQEGGWYSGRQYWGGKLSDPGVINPLSNQQGAGQAVSQEVNAQSAAAQGQTPQQMEAYLQAERNKQAQMAVRPVANMNAGGTGGGGSGALGAGMAGGVGMTPAPTLNLPDLYKSLYEKQGIGALEQALGDKSKSFAEAQLKINDNPFLSESNRVGRVQKLTMDYNNNIKNDQDMLVMKKQDIATQLDLATKQFDINSQAAKQALDQFNSLLQSGALAGASGNDIAAITAATGISSSMVQAAIKAQNEKNVETSISTVDDGTNVYSVVINSKTGEVISKQAISASKPEKTSSGSASQSREDDKLQIMNYLRADSQGGMTLSQIFSKYQGYLEPDMIYQLYNANSKYGPDRNPGALSGFGVTQPKAQEQY